MPLLHHLPHVIIDTSKARSECNVESALHPVSGIPDRFSAESRTAGTAHSVADWYRLLLVKLKRGLTTPLYYDIIVSRGEGNEK